MISTFKTYIQPRRVALYLNTTDINDVAVSIGDKVNIGDPLNHEAPYDCYSTVSGEVMQIMTIKDAWGKDTLTCIIENDYRNTAAEWLRKKDIKDILTSYFKPSLTLERFDFVDGVNVVLNLVFFNEPFVSLDLKHTMDDYESVAHTLQILHELWPFKHIVVLVPDGVSIQALNEIDLPITFKKIRPEKQADFAYVAINQTFKQALFKERSYRYLTLESVLKMHDMIQNHRPCINTRLVVSGEAISTPTVFTLRLGTMMQDIRRIFQGYTTHQPMSLHINELIRNVTLPHDTFAITNDMLSLHAQEHREAEHYECIACGRCNERCPVGILPSKIMHTYEHGIVLEHMKSDVCIECGLCAYYCPSKINVTAFVQNAKKKLRGDDK